MGDREDAAGGGGGAGGADASREGSVPDVVAEAQSRLWEASQRWEEQLSGVATQQRRLVCQRYKPLDLAQLQVRQQGGGCTVRVSMARLCPARQGT